MHLFATCLCARGSYAAVTSKHSKRYAHQGENCEQRGESMSPI